MDVACQRNRHLSQRHCRRVPAASNTTDGTFRGEISVCAPAFRPFLIPGMRVRQLDSRDEPPQFTLSGWRFAE